MKELGNAVIFLSIDIIYLGRWKERIFEFKNLYEKSVIKSSEKKMVL
jgi:hypothetical protein